MNPSRLRQCCQLKKVIKKQVRTKLSGCPLITRYVRTPKTRKRVSGNPTAGAVSLRLGHAAGLTVPRTVIQYRIAASLPRRSLRKKAVP